MKPRFPALLLLAPALLWLAFTAGLSILRYRLNLSSTFDFGIFSQMYYYMDKGLGPLTTCERDGLLSHFAVHLSPIFYLLLPVYHLFPFQETLLLLQALLVISGLIPFLLLSRRLGLSSWEQLGFGMMYCLYPAFMGGCFYDFHENAFLAPLVLWVLYFLKTERIPEMLFFAALLLSVKEDAPVYAACIGLYAVLTPAKRRAKGRRIGGALLFLVSCLYFCFAVWYINQFGDGAMISRFDNYISNKRLGLISMFKTILVDPAYVLSQIFASDKLIFLLQMLLPVGFLPVLTRKWQRWILLIPFVLINLMSNYPYQHSIYFQYTFGSGALLLFLALLNFADRSPLAVLNLRRRLRTLLVLAALISGLALTERTVLLKSHYLRLWSASRQELQTVRGLLARLPKNASIKSSTFLVPLLSQRDEIYQLDTLHPTDYAVVDLRPGSQSDPEAELQRLNEEGYRLWDYAENYVAVLSRSDSSSRN